MIKAWAPTRIEFTLLRHGARLYSPKGEMEIGDIIRILEPHCIVDPESGAIVDAQSDGSEIVYLFDLDEDIAGSFPWDGNWISAKDMKLSASRHSVVVEEVKDGKAYFRLA